MSAERGRILLDWLGALMLGMAHTLVAEGLHDRAFIDRYCAGWGEFEAYLLGRTDGQPA